MKPRADTTAGRPGNLYSITKNQDAIRRLFEVTRDSAGNLPPLPGIFPDYPAPIVRVIGGERELTMMRWGMPGPPQFGGAPITNIRGRVTPELLAALVPRKMANHHKPYRRLKSGCWLASGKSRQVASRCAAMSSKNQCPRP
jgi:hypothetical protein